MTGWTFSMDFPTTTGAYDRSQNSYPSDTFITKLAPGGATLAYSTYLGGTDNDYGYAITVDTAGSAYVTGHSFSSDFPTTALAFDTTSNGNQDSFVTKLNPAGNGLDYSTYLGGVYEDSIRDITVNSAGEAFLTGRTCSSDFPTTAGAFDTTFIGPMDSFVSKLNNTGSDLVFSTFLGASNAEEGNGIAVDADGNAYVTGTCQPPPTFTDVFIKKLNSVGSALFYATYLGGGTNDFGQDIVVDDSGSAYVTGSTDSFDFPVTAGAYDTTFAGLGWDDAFVFKLNPAGSALVFSTFLGMNAQDEAYGIAVDSAGNVCVTGRTESPDFPTTPEAFDPVFGGWTEAFVTKLNSTGSTLIYSTLLGGSNDDEGGGITVDIAGNAFITGTTWSSDFPTTAEAYDTINGYGPDVFVLMISFTSGDLNHDGVVDAADLAILAAYLAGTPLPVGTTLADCELVVDGAVNAADLCWLQNRVAGNID